MDEAEIVRIAVEAAKKYDQEQRTKNIKHKRDRRLHNTRLLLKHYNRFKDHIDKAIYSVKFVDDISDIDEIISIHSIKDSISRSHIVLTHVKTMLDLYQKHCDRLGVLEQRRIRTLKNYYFKQMKLIDIATIEGVDERTSLRDLREAENNMCAFIFGIEGIDTMSETCLAE